MSKILVGSAVYLNNGKPESEPVMGTVVAREEVQLPNKRCEIKYMVKPMGTDGFDSYQVVTRKELVRIVDVEKGPRVTTKVYKLNDGYILTLVAIAERVKDCFGEDYSDFAMGYSICSPADEFDETFGFKAARHRAKHHPFCAMVSDHRAEFDEATMTALMDVKAEYIKNHPDRFINRK